MRQKIGISFLIITVFLIPNLLMAQGKKPEVLIYGNGIDAYTAAIQSAKSRLNTVWVFEEANLREVINLPSGNLENHTDLNSGIWADLLAAAMGSESRNDSLAAAALRPLNPQLILNAMEEEIKMHPHLNLIAHSKLRSAKKSSSRWEVVLENRQKFKIRALVDASENGKIAQMAGLTNLSSVTEPETLAIEAGLPPLALRTSVAVSTTGEPHALHYVPLALLIQQSPSGRQQNQTGQNIFFTKYNSPIQEMLAHSNEDLPLLAHVGQAAGAAAGYVAFFKTTSEKTEVRQVQGELLQYGARLIPYQDVKIQDPNFAAIQRIGATGMFPGVIDEAGRYCFAPNQTVPIKEIRPVLNELFSRSQIWFSDKGDEIFTLSELMALIKYISHRGNELETSIERNWERKFKFNGDYDPQLEVTRSHVAVLLDEYCKPFDVRIDLQGKVTR